MMVCLPPVWIGLAAMGALVASQGWEPFVDIAAYAFQRLFF